MTRSDVELVQKDGKALSLAASPSSLSVSTGGISKGYTWWDVIWVELKDQTVTVHAVEPEGQKPKLYRNLKTYSGSFKDASMVAATERWCTEAMQFAYPNSKPGRRLKVLINPFGGKGQSVKIFKKHVQPLFDAAHCPQEIIYTKYSKHAYEIVKDMKLDTDCIVTLSGDGLVHECLNALADHSQSKEALSIPVCPVPTGSGNGLSVSLLGLKNGFDVSQAAINAIKGVPVKMDLCSVTQEGRKPFWSFMTQAMGLMAELDLGTEHLRWMGETRFMYGYIRGVIANKPCKVKLEFKKPQLDKQKLISEWNMGHSHRISRIPPELPALSHMLEEGDSEDEWVEFEHPWLHCVAGKVPYVGRQLMQFPLAEPADGMIDICIQAMTTRKELLANVDGGPTGQFVFAETIHYLKAKGYRMTPLTPKGYLAVDGEHTPFKAFEVEVHQGKAMVMSPDGRYKKEFAGKNLKKNWS